MTKQAIPAVASALKAAERRIMALATDVQQAMAAVDHLQAELSAVAPGAVTIDDAVQGLREELLQFTGASIDPDTIDDIVEEYRTRLGGATP